MKLLLSHIADIDGVTPVILMNLLEMDFDYKLFEIKELSSFIDKMLDTDYFDHYEEIFITDLSITKEVADKLVNNKNYHKFHLFDHHDSANFLNDYEFAIVYEEINGIKECGTTLFYKYLVNRYHNDVLLKPSVLMFVELVRENDTWQFTDFEKESLDLASIHAFFGNDYYIDTYTKILKNQNEFYFSKMELTILQILNQNKNDYLESFKDKVIIKNVNNYNIGIVFAEQYRSELGHYLAKMYQDQVDFIAIINMNRHISFRGIKDIEINKFAEIYGGGGHPKACAMPLPSNLKETIIKEIFGE